MKKILLGLTAILFIGGCASEFNSIDKTKLIGSFGERPKVTKEVEAKIISDIKPHLKDPYSAKFKVLPYLKKGTYNNLAGWVAITSVNAKNSFGAYTGDTGWATFLITNQKTGKFAFVMVSEPIGEGNIIPFLGEK